MKISFCTQIKNRAWQLRQTIAENLALLENTPHEWVILDVGSTDKIAEVLNPFRGHPNLVIAVEPMDTYRMAAAMNKAMKRGSGDILVSLDCDNFIGQEWIDHILANPTMITHNWSGIVADGTYGRISCPANLWHVIGGFCEDYICGAHDREFIDDRLNRVARLAYKGKPPIKNTKTESKIETPIADWTWDDVVMDNAHRMWERRISEVHLPRQPSNELVTGLTRFRKTVARENVILQYCITFPSDFHFGKEGYLPGLCASSTRTRQKLEHKNEFLVQPVWDQQRHMQVLMTTASGARQFCGVKHPTARFKPGSTYHIWTSFNAGTVIVTITEKSEDGESFSFCVMVSESLCDGYDYVIQRFNGDTHYDAGTDTLLIDSLSLA